MQDYDVIVIGAGICGAACGYVLSQYSCRVLVIERENDVACGTTKANSGIIHAGYDPQQGTIMARTNVNGNKWIRENASTLGISFRQTGSLVVAFNKAEEEMLEALLKRGIANGVEQLTIINGNEARLLEPALSADVTAALHAKTAGVISPWDFALKLMQNAVHNGVSLVREENVEKIEKVKNAPQQKEGDHNKYIVKTDKAEYSTRFVVNAAGLNAGEIWGTLSSTQIAPAAVPFKSMPTKGEYYLLDKSQANIVNTVIFQCPNENGKGVLVAQTSHGNVIVGPSATPTDKQDTATSLAGLEFVRGAAVKSVPSLSLRDNIRNFAGVRAGTDREDFVLEEESENVGVIHLAGIKSPGLTAAPALALEVVELLQACGLTSQRKSEFNILPHPVRMAELSHENRASLIEESPLYGRIICRCEMITEGEIIDSFNSLIPPLSIDGVKRRCGSGMGRCQGGFCSPLVHRLLARQLNVSMEMIPMDNKGSFVLTGKTKDKETYK